MREGNSVGTFNIMLHGGSDIYMLANALICWHTTPPSNEAQIKPAKD